MITPQQKDALFDHLVGAGEQRHALSGWAGTEK